MLLTKFEEKDSIVVLSIDRPKELNALSREIVNQIDVALEAVEKNENVKVLMIYSEGNFAAGADIKAMVDCTPEEAKAFAFTETFNHIANLGIPTIAVIEGYALGGGLELALACDMRIASTDAKLGFPEMNLGIFPGAGGTVRAPRLIGFSKAIELIMTGKTISAEYAEQIGLINSVSDPGEAFNDALKLAKKITAKSASAARLLKKSMLESSKLTSADEAAEVERENWSKLFDTYDQKEGMRAFIEKRKPEYKGR